MRFNFDGLWRLKPFDESADHQTVGAVCAVALSIGVVLSFLLAVTALGLIAGGKTTEGEMILATSAALSAVTAGVEWHSGLKGRALNQLSVVLLVVIVFVAMTN